MNVEPTEKKEILERFRRSLVDELSEWRVRRALAAARGWWQFCGGDPFDPERATSERVLKFLYDNGLNPGTVSIGTARDRLTGLRHFYRFALRSSLAPHNPTITVTTRVSPLPESQSEMSAAIDLWADAMRRRGLSEGTVQTRLPIVRRWWQFCGGDPFDPSVTWRDVELFVDQTLQFAANSRYSTVSHLHMFYLWARRHELVNHDPTELVERPKINRRLPRPITETDLALALAMADPTIKAALLLAAGSGLRAIEISRLRWDDIEGTSVRLLGKGSKERVIPLHSAAAAALDELDRVEQYVFGAWRYPAKSLGIERHEGARASQAINGFLHGIGVHATLHQLRHYAATQALRHSGDLRAVQEILGHSSPATTAIYTRVLHDHLVDVVEAIPLPGFSITELAAQTPTSDKEPTT